jgi:hypothetical protein
MTLNSRIFFTLFIILQAVGLLLLLGLLAVKSLPSSDSGKAIDDKTRALLAEVYQRAAEIMAEGYISSTIAE